MTSQNPVYIKINKTNLEDFIVRFILSIKEPEGAIIESLNAINNAMARIESKYLDNDIADIWYMERKKILKLAKTIFPKFKFKN